MATTRKHQVPNRAAVEFKGLAGLEGIAGVRNAAIFAARYGLFGYPAQTYQEIATAHQMTRQRVQQIVMGVARRIVDKWS